MAGMNDMNMILLVFLTIQPDYPVSGIDNTDNKEAQTLQSPQCEHLT